MNFAPARLSSFQRIDQICDRFEAAWPVPGSTEPRPRIGDFLGDAPEPERSRLLAELLALELAYRRDLGEEPALADYLVAFSEHHQVIRTVFQKQAASERADSTRQSRDAPDTMNQVRAPDGSSAVGTGLTAAISSASRFRPLRLHAEGGLGEVHVAQDCELHREVALKRIRDEYADDPDSRHRFLREAEITGGLEHPGIVPVYGLGQSADGRPYYAMRFIQGNSLKQAIERFHQAEGPKRDPGERTLALRELLGRFVAVCNAVAYAHSRGVLHRDLKPDNVMLGPYGETLVVDWGLAKPVAKSGEPEASATQGAEPGVSATAAEQAPLRPTVPGGAQPSQEGQVMGTPAYMPPEQAAGRLDQLGAASDVYSLGATLYCLLTGQAAFENSTGWRILEKVCRGEFPPPHQIKSTIPRPLAAICSKAMALKPADRYASARALADDIEHWLADEPVSAWPEPLTMTAGRWMRRHKAIASGTAAAVLVGLIALTAGIIWYQGYQAEEARKLALAEQAAGQRLVQAEEIRGALQQKLGEPGGVFELLNHPEDWQAQVRLAQAGLEHAQGLLASAGEGVEPELIGRAGQLERLLQQDEADRLLAVRLEKIRMELAGKAGRLDERRVCKKYSNALAAAGLEVTSGKRDQVAQRIRSMPIREQVVAALDDWAWIGWRLGNKELADRLLAVAREVVPDPAWGDRLRQTKVWPDQKALTALARKAPAAGLSPQMLLLLGSRLNRKNPLRQAWMLEAQARFPADFWLNYALASILSESDPVEAAGYYRVALALRPGSIIAYTDFSAVLSAQNKVPEAMATIRKAIDLDPRSAYPYNALGLALRHQDKLPEAIAAYRKAIDLDPTFATAHNNLGAALREQNKLSEAIAAFRRAVALDPNLAPAYFNLGVTLRITQKPGEAVAAYRRAIELDPELAVAYSGLGVALYDQRKLPEAIAAHRKAIDLDPKLAMAHYNLGNALRDHNKLPEAIAAFRKEIELNPKYAEAHCNLGHALLRQGEMEQALAALRRGDELGRRQAGWTYPSETWVRNAERLALARAGSDQWEAAFDRADRLGWHDPGLLAKEALCLLAAGKLVEYRKVCGRLVTGARGNSLPWVNELWVCTITPDAVSDVAPIVQVTEAALARLPGNADLRSILGRALYRAGRFKEAVPCLPPDWSGNFLYLAMAHHRLGNRAVAQKWLSKAAAEIDNPNWKRSHWWGAQVFVPIVRREAEKLIAGK
jgi:serine/threonine protein kinase/Tfp pilus assembly protein PilF